MRCSIALREKIDASVQSSRKCTRKVVAVVEGARGDKEEEIEGQEINYLVKVECVWA